MLSHTTKVVDFLEQNMLSQFSNHLHCFYADNILPAFVSHLVVNYATIFDKYI
jgi:hypothetical protein